MYFLEAVRNAFQRNTNSLQHLLITYEFHFVWQVIRATTFHVDNVLNRMFHRISKHRQIPFNACALPKPTIGKVVAGSETDIAKLVIELLFQHVVNLVVLTELRCPVG